MRYDLSILNRREAELTSHPIALVARLTLVSLLAGVAFLAATEAAAVNGPVALGALALFGAWIGYEIARWRMFLVRVFPDRFEIHTLSAAGVLVQTYYSTSIRRQRHRRHCFGLFGDVGFLQFDTDGGRLRIGLLTPISALDATRE